jgi:chromosome segregation ATPase
MFKKLLIAAVVVGAAVVVFKGTRLAGYAKDEIASLKSWVESKVPPEKEIARLRKEVAALDKDIEAVKGKLAREIVECRYIKEDADKLRTRVDAEQVRLIEVGDQIKAATEQVKYGGRTVNAAQAKEMLKADVTRHLTSKKNLEGMEAGLASREKIKAILEAQLEELKSKKFELASAVDAAEVELKDLQLKQMENKYQFDDTRLAGIKDSLRELRKKIDVEREKLNLAPVGRTDAAPTTGTLSSDTVDDILAPLTTKPGSKGSN